MQFTVRPGATVTGRVLTPEGTPAADARVSIYAPNDPTAHQRQRQDGARTAAIASPGWSTGSYTISAYSENRPGSPNRCTDIALTEGKETDRP